MLRVALSIVVAASFTAVVSAQDKAAIDKGMALYEQQKCSLCHSIAGKGNAKGPLDEVGSKLSAEDIRQWLVDPKTMTEKTKAPRRPVMRAYANLPKADVDALVAYMLSLKKK